MIRNAVITTEPTSYPLTVAELKENLRVVSDHENRLIDGFLKAASRKVHADTQRSLVDTVYEITLNRLARVIPLQYPPTISVKVFYRDDQDAEQEVDSNIYYLDVYSLPARLVLKSGSSWPETSRAEGGYRVEWHGGYLLEDLPSDLRDAVMVLASYRFRNRGTESEPGAAPDGYRGLIRNFVVRYEYGY